MRVHKQVGNYVVFSHLLKYFIVNSLQFVSLVQDCNGDKIENCEDFARLHLLGTEKCTGSVSEFGFWKLFRECRDATIPITSTGFRIRFILQPLSVPVFVMAQMWVTYKWILKYL